MKSKGKTISVALLAASLLGGGGGLACFTWAAEPTEALTATSFAQYQRQIKPQSGESRWLEVPWFLDLHAARQKAAAEGKPMILWSGGGAPPVGGC